MSVPGRGAIGSDHVALFDDSLSVRSTSGEPLALCDVAKGSAAARGVLRARLAGGGDVASACVLQGSLGGVNLFGGVTVNRQQSSAALNSAFVALRFVFGDAHTDEGSDQAP